MYRKQQELKLVRHVQFQKDQQFLLQLNVPRKTSNVYIRKTISMASETENQVYQHTNKIIQNRVYSF